MHQGHVRDRSFLFARNHEVGAGIGVEFVPGINRSGLTAIRHARQGIGVNHHRQVAKRREARLSYGHLQIWDGVQDYPSDRAGAKKGSSHAIPILEPKYTKHIPNIRGADGTEPFLCCLGIMHFALDQNRPPRPRFWGGADLEDENPE